MALLLAGVLGISLGPAAAAADLTAQGPTREVQAGETLSQIAADVGIEAATLMQLNGITDPDLVLAGQLLVLSASSGAASLGPATPLKYTVAPGDTLWSIATSLGVTSDALLQANGDLASPDLLISGTQLSFPAGGAAMLSLAPTPTPSPTPTSSPAPIAPPAAVAATAQSTAVSTPRVLTVAYTIQPGETLFSVASQFSVSVSDIARTSSIADPNLVATGTVLQVPVPGRERVVQAGETLYSIAAQEKVDLGTLVDANSIEDPAVLRAGQKLKIPAGSIIHRSSAGPRPVVPPTATLPLPAPVATVQPVAAGGSAVSTSVAVPSAGAASPAPPQASKAAPTHTPPAVQPGSIVALANSLLGKKYVFGGSGPSAFDCSGFLWYVINKTGRPISRGMLGQYNAGPHPAKSDLKPGDLVFFQNTYMAGLSHNGIYLGGGKFVHAADEKTGVTISNLASEYWASHWFGATRLV